MVEQKLPFELLKTFVGLIHRQPQFVTDKLNVKSYHLNFLNMRDEQLAPSQLRIEVIARLYLDAIHWAKELNSQLVD